MINNKREAKILVFDIETAPLLSYTWGLWEQNVVDVKRDWYMLSFAAKWLGHKKVYVFGLPDFKSYKKNPEDDKLLIKELWTLFDEADIVVAHNGDKFDIRKANARFITHGLPVPSDYKSIDTLKVAKKYFKFESNKLDTLGETLGLGRKVETGGFSLWLGCMKGDEKSWAKMLKYNKQDVNLLEKVYLRLRPWMTNHPNVNIVTGKLEACPLCSSIRIQKRGFRRTRVSVYQRYQCQGCGGWSTGASIKEASLEIR